MQSVAGAVLSVPSCAACVVALAACERAGVARARVSVAFAVAAAAAPQWEEQFHVTDVTGGDDDTIIEGHDKIE